MCKYILCDLEATGNREKDRIIQLGLMVFADSIYSDPIYIYNELNCTNANMMSEAMELHNITPEMLAEKKELFATEGYKKLCKLNHLDNIFIAHDATSDIKMLRKEEFEIKMDVVDTLRCTKHLFNDLNAYRLQFLRYELDLYKDEGVLTEQMSIAIKAHDALSDIVITKLLLTKLMEAVENQYGIISETAIFEKLIELSSTPVLIKRFKFGKYKDEYIDEIASVDYGYIKWMRNNLTLDEDTKYTLDYYLQH